MQMRYNSLCITYDNIKALLQLKWKRANDSAKKTYIVLCKVFNHPIDTRIILTQTLFSIKNPDQALGKFRERLVTFRRRGKNSTAQVA